MVVSGLKLRQMNEADRDAVGFVGFAAWRSGEAFDDSYLDPDVIERVSGESRISPSLRLVTSSSLKWKA